MRDNSLRVGDELKGQAPNAPVLWYAVPALSSIQRLPDQYPVDGKLNAPLRVVAMRGEFEPASFVVYTCEDAEKFLVTAGDLRSAEGAVLPKSEIDIKLVKVWYQNCNGWYSYFGDVGLKLVPELLVNDENLIKVDTFKKANYLRVNYPEGYKYIWISAPEAIDASPDHMNAPVADAKTLQPVTLEAGRFKQFMVTFHIGKDVKPGLYTGAIRMTLEGKAAGSIPVRLRVLPHRLPDPKTYYDCTADFYTMLYCVPGINQTYEQNGHDREQSDAKQLARFQNQVDHNILYPLYLGLWTPSLEFYPLVAKAV